MIALKVSNTQAMACFMDKFYSEEKQLLSSWFLVCGTVWCVVLRTSNFLVRSCAISVRNTLLLINVS
jgi:hypothetical protein